MKKWHHGFIWTSITRIILKNRILLLFLLALLTAFMALQWKNIKFSFTEANLLPDEHPINQEYENFKKIFGEEGNVIVIGAKKSEVFNPKVFNQWTNLIQELGAQKEISLCISVNNLKIAKKNDSLNKIDLVHFINHSQTSNPIYLDSIKNHLFKNLPIYDGLLYNFKTGAVRSVLYMDKKIVNKKERQEFIVNVFIPLVEKFKKETGVDLKVSGMPYIRTMNAMSLTKEIGLLIFGALGITSFIFFLFFRSLRATLISVIVVVIGVIWSFGTLGLLHYQITVLTALIPPLIIVIGIPNCIFLITKYQQEVKNHGNQTKSLLRVITKTGNATLFTNLTTAAGFATFLTTNNVLLREFGLVASINIILLFLLSLVLIPIFYSFLPIPKERHLYHLEKNYLAWLVDKIEEGVRHHRFAIFSTAVCLLLISAFGINQIKVKGSIIEDLPKKSGFYQDILFYENQFNGIMPLEIMVDTQQKGGVYKPKTLNKINQLQEEIILIPELSSPISVVNVIKYAKQSYYNGNPEYYSLPTTQERNFIGKYIKNSVHKGHDVLSSYSDSTGRYARITSYMKDMPTQRIEEIEQQLESKVAEIFPKEQYKINITGKALLFQKGTGYLIQNLAQSLIFAIFIIGGLITYMFRSYKMVIIALIPNLLPLFVTAGVMGFLGIPIKPSTILVFGIAFGISVDDTIHFLAKYRQELQINHWKIEKSVIATLREAGVSMFYTSIVLFFGFSVFMISEFGGTVALGGLVSITLLFAMFSNLILLPSLLLSLEKSVANKKDFIQPKINILYKTRERFFRNNKTAK